MKRSTATSTALATTAAVALLAMPPGVASAGPRGAAPLDRLAQANSSACVVRDGTASSGQRVGSNPVRFQYALTPYLGARFDSCKGAVTVYFGYFGARAPFSTHYNLAYGQKAGLGAVFSHQIEIPFTAGSGAEPWRKVKLLPTHETDVAPISAFLRVQRCLRPGGLFRSSRCGPWGPTVTVSLEGNALN